MFSKPFQQGPPEPQPLVVESTMITSHNVGHSAAEVRIVDKDDLRTAAVKEGVLEGFSHLVSICTIGFNDFNNLVMQTL